MTADDLRTMRALERRGMVKFDASGIIGLGSGQLMASDPTKKPSDVVGSVALSANDRQDLALKLIDAIFTILDEQHDELVRLRKAGK